MSNDEFIQYVIKYLAENNNPQKEEVYNHFSEECRRREISENDFYETVLGPASRSIDWDENDTEEMKIVISPDRGTNSTTKQVLDNSSIEKSNPDVDISAYNGQNSPETKKKLSLKAYIQSNNFVFWGFIVLAACIIFFFLIGLGSDKPCTGWDCDGRIKTPTLL